MFQCGNTIKYIKLTDFLSYIEQHNAINYPDNLKVEKLVNNTKTKKKELSIEDFENIEIKDVISLWEQTERDFEE